MAPPDGFLLLLWRDARCLQHEEELAVAGGALEGGRVARDDGETSRGREGFEIIEDLDVLCGVADDAAFADVAAADFELRFHQGDDRAVGTDEALHGGEDEAE